MPGEAGLRLYHQICEPCWQEWLQFQTALINHYGLAVRDPRAKEFLTQQRETFFFEASPTDTD